MYRTRNPPSAAGATIRPETCAAAMARPGRPASTLHIWSTNGPRSSGADAVIAADGWSLPTPQQSIPLMTTRRAATEIRCLQAPALLQPVPFAGARWRWCSCSAKPEAMVWHVPASRGAARPCLSRRSHCCSFHRNRRRCRRARPSAHVLPLRRPRGAWFALAGGKSFNYGMTVALILLL